MFKRTLAAVLWFLAINALWSTAAYVTGWTEAVSPIIGLAAALFVGADPLHLFWPARPKPTLVQRLTASGVIQA
jgi:hypothetical protein